MPSANSSYILIAPTHASRPLLRTLPAHGLQKALLHLSLPISPQHSPSTSSPSACRRQVLGTLARYAALVTALTDIDDSGKWNPGGFTSVFFEMLGDPDAMIGFDLAFVAETQTGEKYIGPGCMLFRCLTHFL